MPSYRCDHCQAAEEVAKAKRLLNVHCIARLVESEPRLLDSEGVEEALAELERLMATGTNCRAMLLNDTSILLRVQRGTPLRGQRCIGENPDSEHDSSYLDDFVPPRKDYLR
jgi:hypothetical protein